MSEFKVGDKVQIDVIDETSIITDFRCGPSDYPIYTVNRNVFGTLGIPSEVFLARDGKLIKFKCKGK